MDTAVNLSRLVWGDDARRALSYKGGHLRCVFGVLISPCSLEVCFAYYLLCYYQGRTNLEGTVSKPTGEKCPRCGRGMKLSQKVCRRPQPS